MIASVLRLAAALLVIAAAGCSRNEPPSLDPDFVRQEMEKAHGQAAVDRAQAGIQRGRTVYQANCTACHNSNPKAAGALGPDVWGSSRQLVETRVMMGGYPPGYKPKRATHVMKPLPQLGRDIESLTAYLNSPTL